MLRPNSAANLPGSGRRLPVRGHPKVQEIRNSLVQALCFLSVCWRRLEQPDVDSYEQFIVCSTLLDCKHYQVVSGAVNFVGTVFEIKLSASLRLSRPEKSFLPPEPSKRIKDNWTFQSSIELIWKERRSATFRVVWQWFRRFGWLLRVDFADSYLENWLSCCI